MTVDKRHGLLQEFPNWIIRKQGVLDFAQNVFLSKEKGLRKLAGRQKDHKYKNVIKVFQVCLRFFTVSCLFLQSQYSSGLRCLI